MICMSEREINVLHFKEIILGFFIPKAIAIILGAFFQISKIKFIIVLLRKYLHA